MRQNTSIGKTLALAIQEVLNQEVTDKDPFKPRPISKVGFSLDKRGDVSGIDGLIDPTHLGLVHPLTSGIDLCTTGSGFRTPVALFHAMWRFSSSWRSEPKRSSTHLSLRASSLVMTACLLQEEGQRGAGGLVLVVLASRMYSPGRRNSSALFNYLLCISSTS